MNSRIRLDLPWWLVLGAALGLLLAFLVVSPPAYLGALDDPPAPPDGDELARTRWTSIDGRQPLSFQRWRAAQPPPAPLRVQRVYASPALSTGAGSAPVVCALVNPLLYNGVAASLARWAADVEREGWNALIYSASFPDPPALRAHLASIADLQGCLLIGDFPIPWFRWTTKDFPFDLYYMDLDGVWHDPDGDGLYEDHTGDIGLEIWIGRMTAGNLTFGGDEAALVNNYFRKNHAYRTGELVLPARALVYVDDDWAGAGAVGLRQAVSLLYPDMTAVLDNEATRPEDYGRRLADNYAWIHLLAHATATYHVFEFTEENPPYGHNLYNENVYDIDPRAFFYNFFACGVGRFTEPDYLAGWYIFSDSYGLAAWASTSGGGMVRDWDKFYGLLAQGESLGAAHLGWYAYTPVDRGWHYGLIVLGDPTLTVDTTDPPAEPPAALALTGPSSVSIGLAQPFVAAVEPPTATLPLRYAWQVTDKVPVARNGGLHDARSLSWAAPGLKTVAATATNFAGTVTGTHALTVHAPDLGLAPRALSETLVLGTALTRSLTLSNAGPGDLAFRLVEAGRAPHPGIGPDPFGYTYLDSNQPHGPVFHWIEIAPPAGGSGVELVALTGASNGYAYPVTLPFAFYYYGTGYDRLAVHADGSLSWSNRPVGSEYLPLPSPRGYEVERLIAHFWRDLTIDPGAVYVQDVGSAFVIEYYRVSRQAYTDDPGTWEIVLYENGNILFQYQDVDLGGTGADNGRTATVGIQGDALTGLQYSYNAPSLSPGLAICFAYPGQLPDCSTPIDAPWLSVGPAEGVVSPSGGRSLDLVLDARAPGVTRPGLYRAALVALTNDPEASLVTVPVTMTVLTPTYGLALTPVASARFGQPGTGVTYTLHVTNTGNAPDLFDVALDGAVWPTVAPATIGPLNGGESATLGVTVAIPPSAAHGAADAVALTLTSRGDSACWVTAALTTTAQAPQPPWRGLFLPFVARPPGG